MPPMRSYPPGSPILDSARNALLARGQPLNYGLPKNMSPHSFHTSGAPASASGSASHFKPLYDNANYKFSPYASPPSAALNKALHYSNKYPIRTPTPSAEHASELFLHMKYGYAHSSADGRPPYDGHSDRLPALELPVVIDETSSAGSISNGLAALERAFGDRRMEPTSPPAGRFSSSDCRHRSTAVGRESETLDECTLRGSNSSDVDCEEIDDDEMDV